MAANNSELQQILLRYIGSRGEGRERMREVLQATSVEVRYNALMYVRGEFQHTAVHRAAWIGDLDSLKCMMSDFTSDQSYDVVKAPAAFSPFHQVPNACTETALHGTACTDHTNITNFLLIKLSENRFDILKMQDSSGSTPLHRAAKNKHTADLLAMLIYVSADQQKELLNIKDVEGNTIDDITPLPDLPYDVGGWTNIELGIINQKLAEVEKQQKATVEQHKVDSAKQREDNAKLSDKCEQQGQELSNAKEQITTLLTSNVEMRMDMSRQVREHDKKLEAVEREQKATIGQLEADLAEQREDNARQAQELNQKLEAAEKEQKATIGQLEADLVEQREDNARQAQELRSLVDRQERMENMMEEMERLLRQPIRIGPEMDQEYEG